MSADAAERARERVDEVYRSDSRRVLATLIRLLGDFDIAEEALHDAFRAALEQWPRDGVPANPRAWLVSAGRFKAIDGIRRRARFDALDDVGEQAEVAIVDAAAWEKESVEDDRLRLVFTCCHPALSPDAQVALTLREVCGLTTEAIASAFLIPTPTLAQRIVRAKAKIIGQKKIARQDLGGLAMTTALDELYGLGYANTDAEDAKYEAVTLAQVKAAAKKYLKPDAVVIAVVKPEKP